MTTTVRGGSLIGTGLGLTVRMLNLFEFWLINIKFYNKGDSLVILFVVSLVVLPEREVVPEELHDQRAVLVVLFVHVVDVGDGLVEGLFKAATCSAILMAWSCCCRIS